MIRIGIVGENYHNDSVALKNLLEQRYNNHQFQFIPLLRGTTGDKLESHGIKRLLEIELAKKNQKGKLHFIIFFRDLDSLPIDKEKIKARQDWFKDIKLHDLDTLFIAIFESEALLLADIETVNDFYTVKIKAPRNPLSQKDPKEWLRRKTQEKYKPSDCPDIFSRLNIDQVYENHSGEISFQAFIQELNEKLGI